MKYAVVAVAVLMMAARVVMAQEEAKGGPEGRGPRGPQGTPEERFKAMDKNGNGTIEKDEFRGPPEAFAKIDTDGNGSLSKEELKAGREQMRGPRRPGGRGGPGGEGAPQGGGEGK